MATPDRVTCKKMASLPQHSERDDDLLAPVSPERASSHEQAPGEGVRQGIRPRRRLVWALAAVLIISGGAAAWYSLRGGPKTALGTSAAPAVPVAVGVSETKSVPVYLVGLGTVQAFNTVTVKVRVDGQLDKIAFTEGQDVKAGDVLAQIDPRPFQAALERAKAAKAKDEAQLENAKLDLQRFTDLGPDFANPAERRHPDARWSASSRRRLRAIRRRSTVRKSSSTTRRSRRRSRAAPASGWSTRATSSTPPIPTVWSSSPRCSRSR